MEYDFIELVNKRQSCRYFNGGKVEINEIKKIIDIARFAPSACNSQPWDLVCITEYNKVKEIAQCLQDEGHNLFLDKASAFIAIIEKEAILKPGSEKKFSSNHFVKYDIGQITAYLTLSATYYKIASCIIGWVNNLKIKTALNLSDNEVCNIVVALGRSDGDTRLKKRKEIDEITTWVR